MDITIPYIEQKFGEFNRQIFASKLPMPPIQLSHARTFLGACVYKKRKGKDGKIEKYDFSLRISTRMDLSEQEVEDTILHEMIHYYIGYNQLEDSSPHGQIFRRIMADINAKHGRHITISHKCSKAQSEQAADQRPRCHVVAVVSFRDGRTGIKVLPRVLPSILKYYNGVLTSREVSSVRLYMAQDPYFNQFPNSSSLKVHFIPVAEIQSHLIGAEKLGCDGKRIKRNQQA